MLEKDLLESLENTAFTTGAGANCFFQGFIHTLCYTQEPNVIDNMVKFPGSEKLIEVANREIPGLGVTNINDLVMLAKAMHPLERELIFGPLMRITLNELNLKASDGTPLTLEKDSIIYPPHAVAFAHAFGFSFDEYTHINDSVGMPEELKTDRIGDYYRVRHSLENGAATLVLKLKSCHFEVGGINPDEVASHQSKIIPKTFYGDPSRPELPGARYYEEPSPTSRCVVKNSYVDFNTAVSLTLSARISPPNPLKETRELASLESAREVIQQYKGSIEDTKHSESVPTAATEGDEAVAPSPFQIAPKP